MSRPSTSVARTFLAAGLMAMSVTACNSTGLTSPDLAPGTPVGKPGPATMQMLRFAPDSLVIAADGAGTLQLTGQMSDGSVLPVQGVQYSLSDPSVVALDTLGHFRAMNPGKVYIVATKGTMSARAVVEVKRPSLAHANIKPDLLCIRSGYDYQFVMHTYNEAGQEVTPGATTWSVSDTTMGSINADGKMHTTAKGGHFTVKGTAQGMSDQTEVISDPTPLGAPMTCK